MSGRRFCIGRLISLSVSSSFKRSFGGNEDRSVNKSVAWLFRFCSSYERIIFDNNSHWWVVKVEQSFRRRFNGLGYTKNNHVEEVKWNKHTVGNWSCLPVVVIDWRVLFKFVCAPVGLRIFNGSIPLSIHFFSRQGKQSLLVSLVIAQWPWYRHWRVSC
jgi:hypothetical protein